MNGAILCRPQRRQRAKRQFLDVPFISSSVTYQGIRLSKALQAIRGMNDILPDHIAAWQYIEREFAEIMAIYGYSEIRMPLVENTELFKRSIGEVTDIVEKEMYTFEDRNGDSLTLRPEGTASCVRAVIENGLIHNQTQRLWYSGAMFRHERPQKGRYRQFYQLGAETFGLCGPDIDAELIMINTRLWDRLGVAEKVQLQLNTLGTMPARDTYRKTLVDYFNKHRHKLDDDSMRRLHTNPLRILDSKNPDMQELIDVAPKLIDYVDKESREHFDLLCKKLDDMGQSYNLNTRLVRGLDYYCKTVFEWVTVQPGSHATVCAGGHYDDLVQQLGGRATFAAGFALGMERLVELLDGQVTSKMNLQPHAYMIVSGDIAEQMALKIAESLRDGIADLRLTMNCGGGSFKSQMKRADKSGAKLALLLGEDEIMVDNVTIKYLREDRPQETISQTSLQEFLVRHISG